MPVVAVFKRLHRYVDLLEPWGILIAVIALMMSIISFWWDYQDREDERIVRAWQLLLHEASGNSYKRNALEFLVARGEYLYGVDLSGDNFRRYQYLQEANLENAAMPNSFLRYVDFSGAILSGSLLDNADLTGSSLVNAKLNSAKLRDAILQKSNLSSARIRQADFSGADLRQSEGLSQSQLDEACGDNDTLLPGGLSIPPCSNIVADKPFELSGSIALDVRNALIALGYDKGNDPDPTSEESRKAIIAAERAYGLPADGIPDRSLLSVLVTQIETRADRIREDDR